MLVAARVGTTRLIDNVAVHLEGASTDAAEAPMTPLLCADIGNSHTTIGLLTTGRGRPLAGGDRRAAHRRRVGRCCSRGCSTTPRWAGRWPASRCARRCRRAARVARDAAHATTATCRRWSSSPGVRTGVPVLMDNPREVGTDRIVNALAASQLFGGPAIVVDFGTATTFDVVSARGEYVGGAIAPGIEISLEALGRRGAQLRKVELLRPRSVIAKNTVEALQSGILYGFASQVDGIVGRMTRRAGAAAPGS